MERISHEKYQILQHKIRRIKNDYRHKDVDGKISTCVQLFRSLLQVDNGFTFLDSIKNAKRTLYKDEHLVIQEMISIIFHMISDGKDSELVYPQVMSYIEGTISKNI